MESDLIIVYNSYRYESNHMNDLFNMIMSPVGKRKINDEQTNKRNLYENTKNVYI